MMLSRPIASGAMLVLLIGAVGGAAWQGGGTPEAGVAEISEPVPEVSEAEAVEPVEQVAEPVEETPEPEEQEAIAPSRVVESAGFPVVSQAERDRADEGPIVTVNGRPLDSAPTTAEPEADAEDEAVDERSPSVTEGEEPEESQVAIAEPPLPRPRPEGLTVRSAETEAAQGAETGLDYDAIADAAYGARDPQFSTPSGPQTLEPMPGISDFDPNAGRSNQDELVGVVGPNGEVIWVYEEQVPSMNSRVTVQRQQPVNPFGFVYD